MTIIVFDSSYGKTHFKGTTVNFWFCSISSITKYFREKILTNIGEVYGSQIISN
jgi:hypothetical protein